MRAPDVARQPAQLVQVLDRPAAEEPLAVRLLLDGLRQVRVQSEAQSARKLRRLRHQPLRDGEGRARRDDDLRPRAGPFFVEREEAFGVGEHRVQVLHEVVRRQAALRLAHVHRAARGDDPDSELASRLDLGLDEARAPGWKDVVVVEDRGAPGEHELRQAGARRRVLGVGVDAGPERIERLQPRKEVGLLRPGAGERLIEVVVRVDEPRRDQRAAEVLEVLGEGRRALADLDDEAVLDQDPRVVELRAGVVHGDDVGVREERPHGT